LEHRSSQSALTKLQANACADDYAEYQTDGEQTVVHHAAAPQPL
jgi:hypothetical protein